MGETPPRKLFKIMPFTLAINVTGVHFSNTVVLKGDESLVTFINFVGIHFVILLYMKCVNKRKG